MGWGGEGRSGIYRHRNPNSFVFLKKLLSVGMRGVRISYVLVPRSASFPHIHHIPYLAY